MRTVLDTSVLIGDSLDRVAVDANVVRSYGRLAAAVRENGRRPRARALDLMIAATAHAHGARLMTRNAEDLRGIEELVEIDSIANH